MQCHIQLSSAYDHACANPLLPNGCINRCLFQDSLHLQEIRTYPEPLFCPRASTDVEFRDGCGRLETLRKV